MTKKKWIIIAIAILFIISVFAFQSCKSDAPAAEYVQANLDLIFQGETESAKQFIDASNTELTQMYENGIQAFVTQYLMGEVDSSGAYTRAYEELVKQIFQVMRYQVHEAQKVDDNNYVVAVTYQTVDIFTTFIPELQAESKKIQQALNMGAYPGTEEEQLSSALRDYLLWGQEHLEMCYLDMEYGDKYTCTFVVQVQEDGTLKIQENGVNTFIERILELDKL